MAEKVTKQKAKRGRPAQLSRTLILQCALKLLEEGPAKVSISSVARALNSAPMSLYTHVKNRDDLLLGVADLVLGQLDISIDPRQPWQRQACDWIDQIHAHLVRYPQVVRLIGESDALPPQWLRVHAVLLRCLQRAGLGGETLVHTARWLAQIVISDVLLNSPASQRQSVLTAMEQLTEEQRAGCELLLPYLSDNRQSLFDFVVKQAIARVEYLKLQGE